MDSSVDSGMVPGSEWQSLRDMLSARVPKAG